MLGSDQPKSRLRFVLSLYFGNDFSNYRFNCLWIGILALLLDIVDDPKESFSGSEVFFPIACLFHSSMCSFCFFHLLSSRRRQPTVDTCETASLPPAAIN